MMVKQRGLEIEVIEVDGRGLVEILVLMVLAFWRIV